MKVTLNRDGAAPLSFNGEEINKGTSDPSGKVKRWHEITIYRATAKDDPSKTVKYVAAIAYRTGKRHERNHDFAVVADTLQELATLLAQWVETHDMEGCVEGFPAGPQYIPRRAKVMEALRSNLRLLVSRLLNGTPGTVEEIG